MEDIEKKATASDNGTDIIVVQQDDNRKSDNQPNWRWGRQDTHYRVPTQPPDTSKFFHKTGWDYFWEFLKIGLFIYFIKILKSCLF